MGPIQWHDAQWRAQIELAINQELTRSWGLSTSLKEAQVEIFTNFFYFNHFPIFSLMDRTLFDRVKGGFSNTAGSRGDVDGQLHITCLADNMTYPCFGCCVNIIRTYHLFCLLSALSRVSIPLWWERDHAREKHSEVFATFFADPGFTVWWSLYVFWLRHNENKSGVFPGVGGCLLLAI